MIDQTGGVAGVCIVAAILATLLKQYTPAHAMLCVLGACVAILVAMLACLSPIMTRVEALFVQAGLPALYLEILWKALGVCYLTGIAGDLCRDCGESALAQVAELWGRLALVLLSLPLLEMLLETVLEVLG